MKLRNKLIISYAIIAIFLSTALIFAYRFCEDICEFIPNMTHGGMAVFTSISLITLLFSLILSVFFANRISKPLGLLNAKTKEIARGNYEIKIGHHTNIVEADDLIDSVNSLASTLEEQKSVKKQMASDYAHEFRTPLAAIQSNLEGIIDGVFEPTNERIESIRQEILRLSRMVSEIDKIVEIEKSDAGLHKEEFDLSVLLQQAVLSFENEAIAKNIAIRLQSEPCIITADRDKISQVVINLLSNALKYTDEGQVVVTLKSYRDFACLSVIDTGIGISADDLPHIFDHLYRADKSRARDTGGAGIGLAVAKSIIHAHGGNIEVKSKPLKGSEFIITLNK